MGEHWEIVIRIMCGIAGLGGVFALIEIWVDGLSLGGLFFGCIILPITIMLFSIAVLGV